MDYFFNDLSFHCQFHSTEEFYKTVEQLMDTRREIRRFGAQLFCRREVASAQITPNATMLQAIQGLPRDKRQAWIQWLTQQGPFWLDDRQHSGDDWLVLNDDTFVTETAIGEVAFRNLHGLSGDLVSIDPSDWLRHPIRVHWIKGPSTKLAIDVTNHWTFASVAESLEATPPTYDSWASLEQHVRRKCDLLRFSPSSFERLQGAPYVHGAAERIEIRLGILNTLRGCFDANGRRTDKGDWIISEYFSHEKAWFTDSSEQEKNAYESDLTFPHPERPGKYLFCTWHGKIKSPQIRIHFSWPIAKNIPLYIVYVGPKITKK